MAAAVGLGEDCDTGEAVLAGLLNNSGVGDAAAVAVAGLSCFLLSRLVAMEESNLARIASSSSSSSSSSASTTALEDSFRCLLMWMLFFLAVKELFDLLLSEVFRFRRPPDLLLGWRLLLPANPMLLGMMEDSASKRSRSLEKEVISQFTTPGG